MSESPVMRFLYGTAPGRALLRPMVRPAFSDKAAAFLNAPPSACLIPYYIRKHAIDRTPYREQVYHSFNDFFKRRRTVEVRKDPATLISPCDSFLSLYRIRDDLRLPVKHSRYSVADLLRDKKLAASFAGGLCCVFRLEPQHYHHYLYPADGRLLLKRRINGILHSVRPIACDAFPVWVQNSREYTLLRTAGFGDIVQMEVGALLVGRICNPPGSAHPAQGDEKGYFEFGGSTVILLLQKDRLRLPEAWLPLLDTGTETPVSIGRPIGHSVRIQPVVKKE